MADLIRRHKVLLISFFLSLLIIFVVTNYGVVVTSLNETPGGKPAKITIGSGSDKKEFMLNPGQKRTSVVSRGNTEIKASIDEAYSGTLIKFRSLAYKRVELSVIPPKASEAIGVSEGSCAADNPNYVIYYHCDTNSNYVNATNNGVEYFENIDNPLDETLTFIKPYQSGYLLFNKSRDRLLIQRFEVSGNIYKQIANTSISFGNSITSDAVAIDTSAAGSSKFAVYDNSKQALTIFKDAADRAPQTLNLQGKLGKGAKSKSLISMNGEVLALFKGSEAFEDEGELLVSDEVEQRLLFIDLSTGRVVKEQKIDGKFKLTSLTNNPNNQAVFYAYSETPQNKSLYMADGSSVKRILLPGVPGQETCWADNRTFYLTLGDKEVVSYSVGDGYYRLVYDSKDKSIFGISCFGGSVYISHAPRNLPASDPRLEFVKILNEDLSGVRMETILPLGPGAIVDIDSAFSFRKNVYVNLIDTDVLDFSVNPNNRGELPRPNNPEVLQNNAIDFFETQGVDINKYNFIFNY